MFKKSRTRWVRDAGFATLTALVLYRLRRASSRSEHSVFNGKRVLIVGGSRGLGLLIGKRFAAEGAAIALCARNERELVRAREELRALGAKVYIHICDVADEVQVREFVERARWELGGIDILVNNASIIDVGPIDSFSTKDFENTMRVNFFGTLYATWAALPHFRKQRRGSIVNITSIGGSVPTPHLLPYVAAKYAAVGLSEGLSAELSRSGIQVTTVVPGLMRTGSYVHAIARGKKQRELFWFSTLSRLPFLSMSADRAAARIVEACRSGDPWVTLGIPAKALRLFHACFPGTTIRILRVANRMLPASPAPDTGVDLADLKSA